MESVNLAIRFLVEIGALIAVGYWGWKTGDGGRPVTGGFFRGVLRAPLVSLFVGQKLLGLATKERAEDLRP